MRARPEWNALPATTRESLAQSLGAIAEQLAPAVPPHPTAQTQLRRRSPRPHRRPTARRRRPAAARRSPTGRVGEVARATLNAIDFPSFVASLIQGTFKAIVDASIQQMEAYAELLKNVATTVDQFMNDNVTDGKAKDYLADEHPAVFTKDTSGGAPRAEGEPERRRAAAAAELPPGPRLRRAAGHRRQGGRRRRSSPRRAARSPSSGSRRSRRWC